MQRELVSTVAGLLSGCSGRTENRTVVADVPPAYIACSSDIQYLAAQFSLDVSLVSSLTYLQVWEALTKIPDDVLDLIRTAAGWPVLSFYIAGVTVRPSVN